VFQCDDMKSLDTLRGWVSELQRHALDDLEIVMVASKCDVLLPTLSSSSSSSSSVALSNKNGHGSSKSSKSTSKSKSSPGNGVNGNSRDAEVAQRVMQEAERMAKDLSAPRVALTSAKTGQGIVKLFQTVTQLALRQDAKRQHMHRDEVIGGISQPSRSIILGSLRVETREQDGCCR
jgi:GTPase SAR1 family protein